MTAVFLLTALSLVTAVKAAPSQNQPSLNWQPCPELNNNITILNGVQGATFDCAGLSVPLDYTNPNSEPLQLDLFRVNATKTPVLGSVLINFGGPGGTGPDNLAVLAGQMATSIGEQWNLVSWDPRGTGKTIPFDCKIDNLRNVSQARKRDATELVSANLTEYFLHGGWEAAGVLADKCYEVMNETGQYIGTAFVARDMINIVDALQEDGLLRYYGLSYGTALGAYVAAMFPDRVERIVLDANLNCHDYQAGHYGTYLQDTDKVFAAFLEECLKHKDACALAQYTNANSTGDMFDAVNLLLQPLASNATSGPNAWATYIGSVGIIFQGLYTPLSWPELAETITSLLNGTYTAPSTNSTIEPYSQGPTAVVGIRASDALWRPESAEEYLPQVEFQDTVSSFDSIYTGLWPSARWRINAKERYTGDFRVKTRNPILFVNGELDPVTPLANAYNNSMTFAGSVVLPHSGYGHGTVNDPSACVSRYTRAYFENGTLPESDAHCEPDMGPWDMAAASTQN